MRLHSFRVVSPSCTSQHQMNMHPGSDYWAAQRSSGLHMRRSSICNNDVWQNIARGVTPFAHMHEWLWHNPVHQCFKLALAACLCSYGSLLHGPNDSGIRTSYFAWVCAMARSRCVFELRNYVTYKWDILLQSRRKCEQGGLQCTPEHVTYRSLCRFYISSGLSKWTLFESTNVLDN